MDSLTAESQQESLQAIMPLLEEGRHAEALPLLEETLAKSPEEPLWSYLKALVLACLARGHEALPLMRESARHPQFSAHFGLSKELNTLWTTSALNHLKFETSVEPSDPTPWATLDEFAQLLKSPEYQKAGYIARLKVDPENQQVMDSLQDLIADHPPEETIPALEEVLEEQPDACRPRALLGYHLQRKGKTALAIRHLKTALDADPSAVEPHLYLGRIFASQAKFEDAERELQEAINKKDGPSARLLTELANCQKATYRYEDALETLFSALDLDPTRFEAWEELTELAQATGHGGRLQKSVEKAVEDHPDNLNLRRRLILLCMSNEDPLAARKHLQGTGVFETPGKDLVFARLAAELSMALGETRKATELLEATLESQPNSPVLRLLYGQALQRDHRPQEAEAILRETSKHHPNDIEIQIAWGKSLKAVGDIEKASHAFGLASRLDPDDPEAMAELGVTLLSLGQADEAQNLLKESAKKVDPPLSATLVGLGRLYEQKGMGEVARDFFRDALVGDSSNEDAAGGWFRCQEGDLAESARELLGKVDTPFQKSCLYTALLRAVFLEGGADEARSLKHDVYPGLTADLNDDDYGTFLVQSEANMLPGLARELEAAGELEKTRELWRYAVTSPVAELADRANTELVRLDTVEGIPAVEAEPAAPAEPAAAVDPVAPEAPVESAGDDLSSLLSATMPVPTPAPVDEAPLFATGAEEAPQEEASLFHEPPQAGAQQPAPATPPEEEPSLFSEPVEPSAAEPQTEIEDQLFAEPAEALVEAPAVPAEPEPAEAEELFAPEEAVVAPVAEEDSDDGDLFAEPIETPEAPPIEAEAPVVAEPGPAEGLEETPDVAADAPQAEVVSEPEPSTESEQPLGLDIPLPGAETPAPQAEQPAPEPEVSPIPEATPTGIAPPPPVEGKELLPIPMAVDFQPLTRRQLHYHEVLTQSAAGVVNPESVAHLLLQSSLSHEPPDPGSLAGPNSSTQAIQQSLLNGAYHLEQATQYRGAARILKTALLYNPSNNDVLDALARVQSHWAHWLVQRQEYAHAINLLRDCLQRQPQRSDIEKQMEQIYHHWMAWSEDAGDPAAKALLAVYLEQEKSSLTALRAEWQARQAAQPAPAAPVQSPPPVAPEMPQSAETPVAATPEPEPPQPAAEPVAAQPAVEEEPLDISIPDPTPSEVPVTGMLAQIPAAPEPAPAAEPEPEPAAEPAPAEPVAEPEPKPEPEPTPEPVAAAPAPAAPEPAVEATPEPAAAPEPAPEPAASGASFGSAEEAMAALEASPTDQGIVESLFGFYADSMRDLTSVLREKVSADGDQPLWLLYLARAFRRSGSETMAVIQYQKYIKAAPSPEAYEELAQTYEQIGKEDFANMTRRKAERAFG